MKDPIRLLDSKATSDDVRSLLSQARPSRRMSAVERENTGFRVARMAAIPLGVAAWLSVKGIAFAAGITAASVAVVATAVLVMPREAPLSSAETLRPSISSVERQVTRRLTELAVKTPPTTLETAPSGGGASTALERPAEEQRPSSVSAKVPHFASAPKAVASAPPISAEIASQTAMAPSIAVVQARDETADALSREAALLEQARGLLGSNPSAAMLVLDNHAEQFPHGLLGLEREFMRIDALVRLGRRDEARARAERLVARREGGLYREHLRSLLETGSH